MRKLLQVQNALEHGEVHLANTKILELLESDIDDKTKEKLFWKHAEINQNHIKDYKKSINSYIKVLSFDNSVSTQVKIYEKIADIYFDKVRDYTKARDFYEKLTSFIPKLERYSFYQVRIAESDLHQKKYKKALNRLQEISSEDNLYGKALYIISLSYMYQKNWDKSLDSFKLYIRNEKDISKITFAKFLIANIYENKEELEKAYSVYYSILTDYPEPEIIKRKLKSVYERRVARKR